MDASTTGVGPVLSQQQRTPAVLHPCADFSKKLTQTERNDDIGNWELLAIRLALEEWRHWLDGSKHPQLTRTLSIFGTPRDQTSLSCLHAPNDSSVPPEPILPLKLFVTPIQRSLEDSLTSSSVSQPALPVCPPGLSYLPRAQHIPLILCSYILGHWPYRGQSNPPIA